MIESKEKILLAMSGGTDSSVAAILLLEQGYDVEGVTLITYSDEATFIDDAKQLALELGIGHHVMDVRKEFKDKVKTYVVNEFQRGRTPNPCVYCNEHFKWVSIIKKADELGIKKVASGHYARIKTIGSYLFIEKGMDPSKDQSYFLWRLPQSILKRINFPLSTYAKQEVKEIAANKGFKKISEQKESMGICFLENRSINDFLEEEIPERKRRFGDVVSNKGAVLGKHQGIPFYTIGQKKGLNIADLNQQCVTAINHQLNQLVVDHQDSLWTDEIEVYDYYFVDDNLIQSDKEYRVRIRGIDRVPYHLAKIKFDNEKLVIRFNEPAWAPTPGQSIVVYEGDVVLGGGILD